MTLASTDNRVSYAGNDVTTAFAFNFLTYEEDDLKVILVVDATGVETVQTLTTHYTIAGEGTAALTVTMVTPPATGETLVIIREEQLTQGLDLVENDPFPSALVERQFDSTVMMAQQLNTGLGRTMRLSDGDTSGADPTLPTPTALKSFRWDATGTALEEIDDPETFADAAAASAAAASASASASASSAGSSAGSASASAASAVASANSALDSAGFAVDSAASAAPAADTVSSVVNVDAADGILETNANFVDSAIFGPALDPVDWTLRTAAATAPLMLVTVEDAGADTEVNIWDLTSTDLTAPTPLATITLTGANTVTSVAATMGYVIVGSEDGIAIIDPHDGAWAERTSGWPKTLTASTTPALGANTVNAVAAGLATAPRSDPRTGGPLPTFAVGYSAGAVASVLKDDGTVHHSSSGAAGNPGVGIWRGRLVFSDLTNDRVKASTLDISNITAAFASGNLNGGTASLPGGLGARNAFDIADDTLALAGINGLTLQQSHLDLPSTFAESMAAAIDGTYNTGYMPGRIRGAWLANNADGATYADRSFNGNDLTRTGTLTAAAVATGAELLAYSGFAGANYLEQAYDADFDMGTGDLCMAAWFKTTSVSDFAYIVQRSDPTQNERFYMRLSTTGQLQARADDTITPVEVTSTDDFDDGEWHLAVASWNGTAGRMSIWVDGLFAGSAEDAGIGSISDNDAVVRIGLSVAANRPFLGSLSLVRIAANQITEAQVRHMYKGERGMFVANAKCLLQGAGNTVLDVSVDALTHKVAVTQSDAAMIFDGLVVVSEPSLATGGTTWEHNKLYGDGRVEINDANLYATIPAKNFRGQLDLLRGHVTEFPASLLEQSEAWAFIDPNGGSPIVRASRNLKAIAAVGAGSYLFLWAVPLATDDAQGILTAVNDSFNFAWSTVYEAGSDRNTTHGLAYNGGGIPTDMDQFTIFVIGDLER